MERNTLTFSELSCTPLIIVHFVILSHMVKTPTIWLLLSGTGVLLFIADKDEFRKLSAKRET